MKGNHEKNKTRPPCNDNVGLFCCWQIKGNHKKHEKHKTRPPCNDTSSM
jgi:hypothetical protein